MFTNVNKSTIHVATAPTVYGIETLFKNHPKSFSAFVATAPTVYGIETIKENCHLLGVNTGCNSTYRLRYWNSPLKSK